jgi:phosphotransacetylase/acyl dehydratase
MPDAGPDSFIENRPFDELTVGETASLTHIVAQRDIDLFAAVTGDVNPAHVDPAYAAADMFHHIIMHGLWGGGLIGAVLGTKLPGPGTIYLAQDLRFRTPISPGDTITATVTVRAKQPETAQITLDCACANQDGVTVITGTAEVRAPREKIRLPRTILPEVRVARHEFMEALIARAAAGDPVPAAVVFPVDELSLRAAVQAAAAGLIAPILIGPRALLAAIAAKSGLNIAAFPQVDIPDAAAAAAQAADLAQTGAVKLLMKGDLHTDVLMHAVIAALRTERLISHVYVMDIPGFGRPLLLTDAAINIAPDLAAKAGILRNAIDVAKIIGIATPRVAILAAVETVNPKMPATLDAAALCKMAERGQITGAIVDGPLGFDNAVSPAAAAEKRIVSPVAGRADILLVPDLEAGNMLGKQLTFLSGARAAGIVLGASVPVILTSRADNAPNRLASCALGALLARAATR